MKPSVYIETTIPNFIIGEISPVLVTAGHQVATRQWWNDNRHDYLLYTSQLVRQELAAGTSEYVAHRLSLLSDLVLLPTTDEAEELAQRFAKELRFPQERAADALHLALACCHRLEYLLTWNLKHIANDQVRRLILRFHNELGTAIPIVCNPEELKEWGNVP